MKKKILENENIMVQDKNNSNKVGKIRNMGKRKLILIILGFILLLIIGFRIFQFFAPVPEEEIKLANVKVDTVEYLSFSASSPITGRIEPVEEVSIVPLTNGEVIKVNVSLGEYVEKGTILFETEKSQVQASYNQANASFALAKKSYENMSALYKEGAVSQYDYDQSKVQYESTLASYTAASEAYKNTNVESPIDGYVTSLNVSVGSMISVGNPAASVANVSSLIINTTVSEYLVGHLHVGDTVEIYISTLGDKLFKGVVTALSPAPAKGTLTYPVKISVDDASSTIKAGMFAEVRITSEKRNNVLGVLSDSLIVKNGESMVVVIENQIPIYKKVVTGLDNGIYTEILEGLAEGDTIVIEGQQYVTENVKVNITK